jgi:hypothetical protein
MQPKQFVYQLKSTGAETVAVDVTASQRSATFFFDNVPARLSTEWMYAQKLRIYIRTQLDQPAAGGSIIRQDQFYRALESIQLKSSDLGDLYGTGDINGPQLGLIAQVVSNGYRLPWGMTRTGIAAADGDTAIEFCIDVPIGHQCFWKGHQTGIWTGFFKNQGQFVVNLSPSTWPAAVSTGAAAEATTDVRVELHCTSEPEARVPTIWHWRVRNTEVNQNKHSIRNLCQGKGITGSTGAGKIAMLAYLTDVSGLGGADGADNITRIYPRDRGQDAHNLGSPFFAPASYLGRFMEDVQERSIFPSVEDSAYPLQLGTAVTGRPNVATAYMVPFFWPHVEGGQQVSKLQEWPGGDYYVELDYTAVPAAQGAWISLEQSYLTEAQEAFLMGGRMGLNPGQYRTYPKIDRPLNSPGDPFGFATQQMKLRGIPKKIRAAGG